MSAARTLSGSSSTVPAWRLIRERARAQHRELEGWLFSPEAQDLPLHELEREQERRAREVQRLLLEAALQARGVGDVGPAVEVTAAAPASAAPPDATPPSADAPAVPAGAARADTEPADADPAPSPRRHAQRRTQVRHPTTIFGEVALPRLGYGARGAASIHPLDAAAQLPARTYSYELQRRLCLAAVQSPFDEVIARVAEATGVTIPKRSAELLVREAAQDFDAFYAQRARPPGRTGPIVVAAVDGKGIPMVKPEQALRVVRRGKGQKANKKRMATVAAVFTQQRRVRTPAEVVESLFRSGPRPAGAAPRRPNGPEHKRVWASVVKSKDAVIADVVAEVETRDPRHRKDRAVVTDGERALQQRVTAALPGATVILDLLHVVEKLWKVAYYFHAEGSAAAVAWVRERALRILRGEVSQVVKGLRQSVTKRRWRGAKRETVLGVAAYYYRNRGRMKYDAYLAAGLPIASGSVEGACKNLIKDRMERSGMRWTLETAEAMVQLRAAYLSGDWETYWEFHIAADQARVHPEGRWEVVEE